MLLKLVKRNFKLSMRSFGILYLSLAICLVLALVFGAMSNANFASNIYFNIDYQTNSMDFNFTPITQPNVDKFSLISILFIMIFAFLCIAAVLFTLANTGAQFIRNYLEKQGYFNNCLPVKTWQLIVAEAVIAVAMIVLNVCLLFISLYAFEYIAVFISDDIAGATVVMVQWPSFADAILILVELISFVFCVYAAIMVGYQFAKFQKAIAIIAFIVLSIPTISIVYVHFIIAEIIITIAVACVYFFIAEHLMRKRLNLN